MKFISLPAVRRLLTDILIVLYLAGCALIPLELSAESGQVLFQDNFSSRAGGWPSEIETAGVSDYLGEAYRILVSLPDSDRLARPGLDLADVHLQVESTRISGPVDNRYGVICRYQDENNYYAFLLSTDGYYAIVKMQEGQTIVLGTETMQPAQELLTGYPTHYIEAVCQGQQLTLQVNGRELASVMDSSFSSGDVGLIAGAFSEAGVEILFDNFQVLQP